MAEPIFQDKKLEIYRDFGIIKDYYAPRLDKKLRTSDIENVWVENLTLLSGSTDCGVLERSVDGFRFTWKEAHKIKLW